MVTLKENTKGGVSLEDTDKFMSDIEKRVFNEWSNKEFVILHQGNMTDRQFKAIYDTAYDEYKKELKKLLRTAYKNVFNPLKTLEGLEYIWCKYVFMGVLSEEYVENQRNRMYKSMEMPNLDIKDKVDKIRVKINKRFKK